jgi:hypothetical protein
MTRFLGLILVCLALVVALFAAMGYANDRAAQYELARGRSQAIIIQAQGQARLDSAQAWAVTSAAALPWGALTILGVLGLGILALAAAIVVLTLNRQPLLVERQLLYLPAPGQPRSEVWRALAAGPEIEIVIPNRQEVQR